MDAKVHKIAEDLVRILAHDVGATVNRVDEDEEGWDAQIAYPAPPSDLPPDLRPIGQTCLVQVKSTVGMRRACNLKLSNALRFSRHPLPCFIVLLQFDEGATRPKSVYIRHFWKDDIANTLLAARKAHGDSRKPINQIKYPIKFSRSDSIALNQLMESMSESLEIIGPQYSTEKISYAGNIGYNDESVTASFSHDLTNEDFVDFLIGLRENFPVKDLSVFETRFGISVPHPKFSTKISGTLQIVDLKPSSICDVTIRRPRSSDLVTLVGDVFTPGVKDLPPDLRKMRIAAPPVQIVLNPAKKTQLISASHDPNAKISLESVRDVAGILTWISSGGVEVELHKDGIRFMSGTVETPLSSDMPIWRRLYFVTKAMAEAVPPNRRPPGLIYSVAGILGGIDEIARFAGYSTEGVTMRIEKELSHFDGLTEYLGTYWLQIDDVIFYATVRAAIIAVESEVDRTAITIGKPTILRSGGIPGLAEIVVPRIYLEAEEIRGSHFDDPRCVLTLSATLEETDTKSESSAI